jgi:arabinogalactan oligomer/maltooligosaccharide transport system substrate-binding protein
MKRLFVLFLSLGIAVSAFAQQQAVWVDSTHQFAIEPGAKIQVAVDSDQWGAAIVALWNKEHPNHVGAVTYIHADATGATDKITQLQDSFADVVLCIDSEVSRNAQSLLTLDPHLVWLGQHVSQPPFFENANPAGNDVYIPLAYNGMVFAWNKTMLEKLGYSVRTDDHNLPREFNTWEKIFALAKNWQDNRPNYHGSPVNIVYPMSLTEVWSAYSSLTADGWEIYGDANPLQPGFDKASFRGGLDFIREASKAGLWVLANGRKIPGSSMTGLSHWDDFLNNQTAPFGLVGTWQDVKGAMRKGDFKLEFSPMPTWKDHRLTPFVGTKGFVINGFTHYPSAAEELYRLLYTKAAMEAMIRTSSYLPALRKGSPITPSFGGDWVKEEMAKAFQYSYPEPAYFLPNNQYRKAMDVYYNIPMGQIYSDVWDGKKTPSEGQQEAVTLAAKWLADNNK